MRASPSVPMLERRIGRYLLLHPVGRGAMGIVYRAEDPMIRRPVAVKVLGAEAGLTPSQREIARERFRREAESAGNIDHPHIVRIFDIGEEDGTGELYIVMEYLAGPSLEELIKEGDLDFERSVEIIGKVALGLDAAHAHGLVHRDIKPSNILLTERGEPKLVDFGITYVRSSALTQDITKIGSPAYMSPEQISGKPIDLHADLFSLGVLSYELLTGRQPFSGSDVVSMAYAIAHARPIPASALNPRLPQSVDAVLERMLAKEATDRYASGRAFHEALLSCRSSTAARVPSRNRNALLVVAGLLLVAAAAGVWPRSDERITSPTAATPPVKRAAPAPAPVPKTEITVRLSHRARLGTIVVTLDGAPILTEKFTKPPLAISKTTTWGPIKVPVGRRKLTVKVSGQDGTIVLSEPLVVELPRDRGVELRIRWRGDKLTLEQGPPPG